jgi:hypothetical protein
VPVRASMLPRANAQLVAASGSYVTIGHQRSTMTAASRPRWPRRQHRRRAVAAHVSSLPSLEQDRPPGRLPSFVGLSLLTAFADAEAAGSPRAPLGDGYR